MVLATAALFWPGGQPDNDLYADLSPALDPLRLGNQEMAANLADAQCRNDRMAVLVADLIAGRLTLTAAVQRHQDIHVQHPRMFDTIQRSIEREFPAGSYEASVARSILAHCTLSLPERPNKAAAVLDRLHNELAAFAEPNK
jgi:hypothetical protein